MMIFPNPAQSYFDVQLEIPLTENARWQIHDVHGRSIDSGTLPKQLEGFRYDCTHLPKGIYFISIQTDFYAITPQKIIIVEM